MVQMIPFKWDIKETLQAELLRHLGRDDKEKIINGAKFLETASYYKAAGGARVELMRLEEEEKAEMAKFEKSQAAIKLRKEELVRKSLGGAKSPTPK
jgi:hypothetical protein